MHTMQIALKTVATVLLLLSSVCGAAVDQDQRRHILEATRPVAAAAAGQPVRIKVDRLNIAEDWAVLIGELVGQPSQAVNWILAAECEPDLDKTLWVVLQKGKKFWVVKHIEICAPEPPYWYLDYYGGFVWPCGVYAGLSSSSGTDLYAQCREARISRVRKAQ